MIQMYLMIMDVENTAKIPEFTLWDSWKKALEAVFHYAEEDLTVNLAEGYFNPTDGNICLPGVCEIMPITLSEIGKLTWFGKERVS